MNDVRIDPQFDRELREVLLAQVRTSSKPRAKSGRGCCSPVPWPEQECWAA